MLLTGRIAVIFGGSGAVGGAVAQVMAREGARVFIGGRDANRLQRTADRISDQGGAVEAFFVDVLDEAGTTAQVAAIAARTGGIDVAMNATGFPHDQGTRIEDLSLAATKRSDMPPTSVPGTDALGIDSRKLESYLWREARMAGASQHASLLDVSTGVS